MADAQHLPPNWEQRLLAVLGAPMGYSGGTLLKAWATAEGGSADWNPLNTTYELPGTSDYNADGVKNYAKPIDGICATALTLDNGDYPGIVGDLQGGGFSAQQIVERNAAEFDKWGTGSELVLEVLNRPTAI